MINSTNYEWTRLLRKVMSEGQETSPRGQKTKELLGFQTRVNMRAPIVNVPGRIEGKYFAFMFAEAYWILTGDDRVETIAPYSAAISKFSDDGDHFFGAYGPKIYAQLPYVLDKLSQDSDTRQAVINIWRENPPATKDVPCTLSVEFLIREGRLHVIDTMRSSDCWLGWPFDVFNFSMLAQFVCLKLHEYTGRYVRPGTLFLNAGSQHIYERNFAKIEKILRDPRDCSSGYWETDMTPGGVTPPSSAEFLLRLHNLRDSAFRGESITDGIHHPGLSQMFKELEP